MPPKANRTIAAPLRGGSVIVGHESPHQFDTPSLDYLRTGQGANSYTSGIYNWENPGVGRNYHEEFSRKLERDAPEIDEWYRRGFAYDRWRDWQSRMRQPDSQSFGGLDHISLTPEQRAELGSLRQKVLGENYASGNFGKDLNSLSSEDYWGSESGTWKPSIPYYRRMHEFLSDKDRRLLDNVNFTALRENKLQTGTPDEWAASYALLHPHYDDFRTWHGKPPPPPPAPKPQVPPAFTYQFRLNAPRENFAEFMLPIGAQQGWLRDALMDVASEANDTAYGDGVPHLHWDSTPEDVYEALKSYAQTDAGRLVDGKTIPSRYRESSAHPKLGEFESALLDRGIPGIRYPDSYSRRLEPRSPSRTENFVVYDPSIMELVKRYPYAVLLPMLMSQGQSEEQSPVPSPLAGTLLQ